MQEIIKNGRIVCTGYEPDILYDIIVESGKIKEIGRELSCDGFATDVAGAVILPGFIDMDCRICDPGFEYIEDIESVSLAAASGGFTSITCEPDTRPVIDNKTVVEYITSKSRLYSLVNILPYGSMSLGCEGKSMTEIGEMFRMGIVGLSDGGKTIQDTGLLRSILLYSKMFDLPVITHCDDETISGEGVMNEGQVATSLGLRGIPREAQEVCIARNIVLAQNTKSKLHIANVTTGGAVQLIREAKKRGVNVSCSTSPQYFILTEDAVGEYNTYAKVKPPLRTEKDRLAVLQGIADGTIDVITSGHMPTRPEDKNTVFESAEYGISSLETTFSLSYTYLVDKGVITLLDLIHKMSAKPAEILGLKNKGRIEQGMDADLTIVDINTLFPIQAAKFYSKAKFTVFDGYKVKGKVLYSVVGGRIIY